MSRGLGAVQRRILDKLRQNPADPMDDFWEDIEGVGYPSWTTVMELAGDNPTRAHIESTRRAVLKVHGAGLVDINYVFRMVPSEYVISYGWGGGGSRYWHARTANNVGHHVTANARTAEVLAQGPDQSGSGVRPAGGD